MRVLLVASAAFFLGSNSAARQVGVLERVSLSTTGKQPNADALPSDVSADGRLVLFTSYSNVLVPGDNNQRTDVFLRDRLTNDLTLLSRGLSGQPANGYSINGRFSADARLMVFESDASDLVAGDTNGQYDVFVLDRDSGVITRVSTSSSGAEADTSCLRSVISADGSTVAFASTATTLVPELLAGFSDVFVHDLKTAQTTIVSRSTIGKSAWGHSGQGTLDLSYTGRWVAFDSDARDIVSGDTNGVLDAFLHDRGTGATTRTSVSPTGAQGTSATSCGGLSGNSSHALFWGRTTFVADDENIYQDIHVRNSLGKVLELASLPPVGVAVGGDSRRADISEDGRFVVFESRKRNLVPGDTNNADDIFLRDRDHGTLVRVNVSNGGVQGNQESLYPRLANSGSAVVFRSAATNLVSGKTTPWYDAYVVDLAPPSTTYCAAKSNSIGCVPSITSFGIPRAGARAGFTVHAKWVRNRKPGLLLYGTSGRSAAPFQCGTLCVGAPLRRTPSVDSGGYPPPFDDCSGIYSIDLASFAFGALGGQPQPSLGIPGTVVDCQWWGRDQGFAPPCNSTLSAGLEYAVVP